jgi:STE24 endopeptidase
MPFLLMIFLTVVCLFERYPQPPWSPNTSVALTALAVLLVAAHAFWVSRRVCWSLAGDPSLRDKLLRRYERGRFVHQLVMIGAFVVALAGLGWGWTVHDTWRTGKQTWPGLEVLTLAPFLLSQLLTWLLFYDADRAAHRAAHLNPEGDSFAPPYLDAGDPTPTVSLLSERDYCPLSGDGADAAGHALAVPFGGRWSYVAFQARQKLALVFIPVLLLIVQKEFQRMLPESMKNWTPVVSIAGSVALGGVFVSMPLLIRFALGLKPLPDGPIRDRLLAASKRLNFHTTNILLWNTRNGMANAMVIGVLPWLRYVVFTDRLLEEFSEDEVEAVFGHEVGHVRHQHVLYYLAFLTASMAVLGLVAENYLLPLGEWAAAALNVPAEEAEEAVGMRGDLMVFPIVGLMMVYVFVVFGFLSRRCERQADVFGCRAVSCDDPNCRGHDESTKLTARGGGLCVTGIQTFIRALERVALVNGINRSRPGYLQSWQHSTIAKRVAFLDDVIVDREAEARFQRRLWRTKWGLMAALGMALAAMVLAHGWKW